MFFVGNLDMSKYKVGDLVRVKELDALKKEFGDKIRIPSGWHPNMNKFCGGEFTICSFRTRSGGTSVYYFSEDNEAWMFDECVLESGPDDHFDPRLITMSYEDLFS